MKSIRKWRGVDQMHFFQSEVLNVRYLEAAVGYVNEEQQQRSDCNGKGT